ncbi:type VI secretion system contractile sheath small subunit, partial [Escherichia coli]|nr:type VI secretion system contractile sheath small subunit [Escherichia coli]
RNKLAGNDKLEDLLSEVLKNTQQLQELAKGTGSDKDGE